MCVKFTCEAEEVSIINVGARVLTTLFFSFFFFLNTQGQLNPQSDLVEISYTYLRYCACPCYLQV